jgi:hypothetical protein
VSCVKASSLAAQSSQAVVQHGGGVGRQDGLGAHQQHVARVQARVHLHDGDAGLRVTGLNGAVYGRSTAPAWQQRSVDIEAATGWQVQGPLRQDQAISGHDHGLGLLVDFGGQQGLAGGGGVFGVFAVQAQAAGLGHGHRVVPSPLFNGRRLEFHAAPSRAVGLGQHQHNLVPCGVQGGHGHLGKFGRARKNQTHAVLSARLFGL